MIETVLRRVQTLFALVGTNDADGGTVTACADKRTQGLLAQSFDCGLIPTEANLAHADGRECAPVSGLFGRIRSAPTADTVPALRRSLKGRVGVAAAVSFRRRPARE